MTVFSAITAALLRKMKAFVAECNKLVAEAKAIEAKIVAEAKAEVAAILHRTKTEQAALQNGLVDKISKI